MVSEIHKTIDKALTTLEEFKKFIDNTDIVFIIVDRNEAKFTYVNKRLRKVTGYSLEEFTSKPFIEFVHPDDLEKTAKAFEEGINTNNYFTFTNRYKKKNGGYVRLRWSTNFYRSENKDYSVAVVDEDERVIANFDDGSSYVVSREFDERHPIKLKLIEAKKDYTLIYLEAKEGSSFPLHSHANLEHLVIISGGFEELVTGTIVKEGESLSIGSHEEHQFKFEDSKIILIFSPGLKEYKEFN